MKDKKTIIILLSVIAVIVIGSVIGIFYVSRPSESKTVEIVSNGKVIKTLDLATERNNTFEVENNGKVNVIEVKNGRIRVKSADCPDKVCVDSGWLKSADLPIVCLPNKLIIRFTENSSDIDSISK